MAVLSLNAVVSSFNHCRYNISDRVISVFVIFLDAYICANVKLGHSLMYQKRHNIIYLFFNLERPNASNFSYELLFPNW